MRAAWWWIDRWRKSSAYTDMRLDEQGAYRNLLDELWLRDGLLPDDDRVLGNICGDARLWDQVKPVVLAHFVKTEAGWRHPTHDEISNESARLAQKQADYRRRKAEAQAAALAAARNVTGNVTGNIDGNAEGDVTRSPSPSPSPSPSLGTDLSGGVNLFKDPNGASTSATKISQRQTAAHPNGDVGDARFERFWEGYPNKKGKRDARRAWAKLRPDDQLTDRMIAAVAQQTHWPDWLKERGRFIPHPATWLNRGSWEDEPVTPSLVSDRARENLVAIEGAKALLLKARRG